jgi:thiamine biosynthesis protein ThiS
MEEPWAVAYAAQTCGTSSPVRLALGRWRRHLADMGSGLAISVNGEARQVAAGATVATLLAQLGIDTRKVAVERNLEIVPRSSYAETALAEGDALEIVHFIGGG